ncbi:hypothetical protein SOCEGT47_031460 [Sorangium cellulosum]|uniref:Response regulatory domain-containing protein n=2 Tax=Sorangium cellulosum TaxID=56 RepID=A0A4V0NDH0_SORCE|nr:hypothetical protein SOCEGT47_031460 [Sorangium cellulosum]
MLSSARRRRGEPLHVVIVSDNPETLDGLQAYLQRAGVTAYVTRQLQAAVVASAAISAVVVFPDDYPAAEVEAAVERITRDRPGVLSVLVTGTPQRFEALRVGTSARVIPTIIPKPAWGWTILDTIRALLEP